MIDAQDQADQPSDPSPTQNPSALPAPEHVSRIVAYLQGLLEQTDGLVLYQMYQSDLEQVTPQSVMLAFYQLYAAGVPVPRLLGILDKSINVFHRALARVRQDIPKSSRFLDALRQENLGLLTRLAAIRQVLTSQPADARQQLLEQVRELGKFDDHYQKKENILFPYMERKMDRYRGLSLMWALHDEIRQRLKAAVACLEETEGSDRDLNVALGQLIFGMHGMVNKEEWILFPLASEIISDAEWQDMVRQSQDYAFPFVDQPAIDSFTDSRSDSHLDLPIDMSGDIYQSGTGSLNFEQITQVFAALPVDLTVVDENNRVVYFTRPTDRIFPRSPAIIGRQVEQCHPPQSVGKVMEIIEAFRSGSKQDATFWISLRGRKILIRYFALRDAAGDYKGTLEVSQDISEWQQLEGEKRLTDWQENG